MGQFMAKQSSNGGIGEENLVLEYQKDCDTSYVVVHNSDLQILDSSSPRCGATSNGFKVNVASLICMVTWSMIRCLQPKTKNYRKVYLCLAIFCASLLSIFGLSAFLSASIGKRKDIPWIERHICCSDHVGLSKNVFFQDCHGKHLRTNFLTENAKTWDPVTLVVWESAKTFAWRRLAVQLSTTTTWQQVVRWGDAVDLSFPQPKIWTRITTATGFQ